MLSNEPKYNALTSVEQRYRLFELWEKKGSIANACREASVSRSTFYYWKPRFLNGGYPALTVTLSRAPKNPRRTPQHLADQVIELKNQHPKWGKQKIAKVISHNDEPSQSISPNTVRRILIDASLWDQ
ncbi:MAG: helix-turn-helix domain-containing protein [Chloroflexota bacterium]